jgi:hypothetical protein
MDSIINFILSRLFGLSLHILVEIPATIGFLLFPSASLRKPQPQAHAVIRQYGMLLGSTNLIVAVLLISRFSMPGVVYEVLERRVAGALALYHLGSLSRAAARIYCGENAQSVFTGPWLHMLLHAVCFATLISAFGGMQ